MARSRPPVPKAFDMWGSAAEFLKRSGSWYSTSDEVISVTDLQKSQYGRYYYINQGFWIRELGSEQYPKTNQCHIVMRADDLYPNRLEELRSLLDEDQELAQTVREERLTALLDDALLKLIHAGVSTEGLRALRAEGRFIGAGIRGPALSILR